MRERLTKQDVEKIEKEIEHRKLVVRKEAIEAVKEARAQGVCVLSHPAIAVLSDEIYFPCMGVAFVAFCFLFYFIIRQHRGE